MGFIRKTLDLFTQGSDRPLLRLLAYYLLLGVAVALLVHFVPPVDEMFSGDRLEELTDAPVLLQDGLSGTATFLRQNPRVGLAIGTTLGCLGTLLLMLPVTWVYMVARKTPATTRRWCRRSSSCPSSWPELY